VLIRFRLQSDQLLELDGWYVDNVRVSEATCELVAAGDPQLPGALEFLPAWPNPARGPARLSWALPAPEERVDLAIHDLAGRLVRLERLGPQPAGVHGWTWDGRDSGGRSLAAGAYFVRLLAGRHILNRTLVRLAP
jgi:flagellar hook assembly protein FlgD